MLFRRISKHVTDQNWFAVFLDFFIVVVGILIAFQITNWNERRVESADKVEILQRLNEDFNNILTYADRGLEMHANNVTSAARLINGARSKQFNEENLHTDIIAVTDAYTPVGPSSTYKELVAAGRLSLISNNSLLQELKFYDDYITIVNDNYSELFHQLSSVRNLLLSAQRLKISETATIDFNSDGSDIKSVDREQMINNPKIHTALQSAYLIQNNIHAVFYRNKVHIYEIIELIKAEQNK
jgi:hypothetical protein